MKALVVLPLALVCLAGAQAPPRLDAALAVDIRVKTMEWHPSGETLLYSREEATGVGLGIYRLGDPEGKVVLHLAKDDRWSREWCQGSSSALVTVSRKLKTATGDGNEAALYLVDGLRKTSFKLFSHIVQTTESISVEAELSPSLTHAICTVHVGKTTYTAVLPINGKQLVSAPDIDQAEARGLSGPSWSRNGTALYGEGLGVTTFQIGGQTGKEVLAGEKSGTFVIQLSGANGEIGAGDLATMLTGLTLKMQPPAPPAGTLVLEVVPSNGALRPVRSPGPWVGVPQVATTLGTESHRTWLDFGRSRGDANSLWLMQGPKQDAVGALVAANANSAAISPADKAVAYITDGALFVRRILK